MDQPDLNIEDEFMKKAVSFFKQCEEKYQKENPCPKCGSHNTHFEPTAISGPNSSWSEWCDDCGWSKESSDFPKKENVCGGHHE